MRQTATIQRHKAVLVCSDGRIFTGRRYAAEGYVRGHAAITTAATGYQEYLTDPGHSGEIAIFAAPHIGNTGINAEDVRSDSFQCAGVVTRDPAPASSFRSTGELEDALIDAGVVGICEVDTRALVRHVRGRRLEVAIFSGDALPEGAYEGNETVRMQLQEIVNAAQE